MRADAEHEARVERPPLFPPTFLYTQSWEDPEPDMKVRRWQEVAQGVAHAQSQDAVRTHVCRASCAAV